MKLNMNIVARVLIFLVVWATCWLLFLWISSPVEYIKPADEAGIRFMVITIAVAVACIPINLD